MIKEYLPDSHALTADTGRIQHPDHTHMHKKLCLQGLVATEVPAEVSRVEDVYFFTDFNMIEISRLLDGSITTDVEVYYRVPWYLLSREAGALLLLHVYALAATSPCTTAQATP